MKLVIRFIQVLFLLKTIIEIKTADNCTLTRKSSADPFPSLLKCYKYNNDACCLSVHDDYIDTYINSIFSPSCVRKYPLFEILMCFGCHPNEHNYINITSEKKSIRICRQFAEDLWGGDLNNPTNIFDQCGFKVETEDVKCDKRMSDEDSKAVVDMLYLFPNGFKNRSMVIEGLTTTSLNVGVVKTENDSVEIDALVRAALDSNTDDLLNQIKVLSELLGFAYKVEGKYPGWSYSEVSPMRDVFQKVCEANGKTLEISAAHGGCECGVFKGLDPQVDIISFGPITRYIHTPDEELDLGSFDRSYSLLTQIVEACK